MRGKVSLVAWLVVAALVGANLAAQAPANATAKCKDGTYSTATNARGMCSGHGGVAATLAAKPKAKSKPAPATTTAPAKRAKPAGAPPAGATARCQDGTYSTAQTTRGACSKHGGVAEVLGAAAPAEEPAPAATGGEEVATVRRPGGAPGTATAKCRDGTYSESQQHSGACSHHGGVAEWYR